jgi:sulfite exporter TauE/SafE
MTEIFFAFSAVSAIGLLSLGFVQGIGHATDADHLAAVGTMVSEKKSVWKSSVLGGVWGLGHTLSLIAVGLFVLFMDVEVSERTEAFLEGAVGVMLVLLGLNVFRKMLSGATVHAHPHGHGVKEHVHVHLHSSDEKGVERSHHGLEFSPRALVIGLVHGLAGSAGLMLIVIPTIDTKTLGVLYIAVFGIGSIGGMMLMSLIVGLPFHISALRFDNMTKVFQSVAGAASVVVGILILLEKTGVLPGA